MNFDSYYSCTVHYRHAVAVASSVAFTSKVESTGAVTSFIVPFMSAFASDLAHGFIASDIMPNED